MGTRDYADTHSTGHSPPLVSWSKAIMCSQKLHVDRKWLNKAGEDQQHQDATKTKEVQTVFSKKKKKCAHGNL